MDRPSMTGALLDEGRPVAGAQIRVTNSHRPSRSSFTSTDQQGRFSLGTGEAGSASSRAKAKRVQM
ncbi:DUF6795 domain-containing protein [Labrys sp. 22185]|uniref:DUF6795 domain-containing protein n=1 Tax=Labrys sp. 22185 TaxID=3453888 RepID=UPI003F8512C0